MKIDIIGCMHGEYPQLEGGDLLIVTGDLTARDKYQEYEKFFLWLKDQKYKKKIFISGNHDNLAMSQFDWYDAYYLYDSGTKFEGLEIWGTPWSLRFDGLNYRCAAFTGDEMKLESRYNEIPHTIDILISHSPMYGIADQVQRYERVGTFIKDAAFTMRKPIKNSYENCGSQALRAKVESLPNLKLFCCSHIHEGYGQTILKRPEKGYGDILCVNASIMNQDYEPVNKPIRIEL